MVITDNHVGYLESDPVRGKDALITFEETLQLARHFKVDFILHGGDLFHDSRPSRESVYAVMKLLNRYLPAEGSSLEIASGPEPTPGRLPVFMVHGNHDEPGGEGNLAAADILEAAGLVSYFGKQPEVDGHLNVKPILLKKGETRLALFGLGNLKDERLHRSFSSGKVHFFAPEESGWFNLLTVHQNRYRGNAAGCPAKNCLLETALPGFLDLVVWGHEHESRPQPQEFTQPGFHVLQPGSSVATSLTAGESAPKHIALVEVLGQKFRVTPVPLLSVRPLLVAEAAGEVVARVEELAARGAAQARMQWAQRREWLQGMECSYIHNERDFTEKPLIRIKIPAGADKTTNQKFGLQFSDRVGNPDSILHFSVKVKRLGLPALTGLHVEDSADRVADEEAVEDSVQDIVFRYMHSEDAASLLEIFPEPELNEAVQAFVDRGDPGAIDRYLKATTVAACKALEDEVSRMGRLFDKESLTGTIRDSLRLKTDQARQAKLTASPQAPALDMVAMATPNSQMEVDLGFDENVHETLNTRKRPLDFSDSPRPKRVASPKPRGGRKPWPLLSQQSRSIRS